MVGGMAVVGLYTSSCATQEKQELHFLLNPSMLITLFDFSFVPLQLLPEWRNLGVYLLKARAGCRATCHIH